MVLDTLVRGCVVASLLSSLSDKPPYKSENLVLVLAVGLVYVIVMTPWPLEGFLPQGWHFYSSLEFSEKSS
jgi:hypothetical protein